MNVEVLHCNSNLVLHLQEVLPVSTLALEGLVMIFQNNPLERLAQGETQQTVMVAQLCLPHHVVQNVSAGNEYLLSTFTLLIFYVFLLD